MLDSQEAINHNIFIHRHLYQDIPNNWASFDSYTSYVASIFEEYLKFIPLCEGYIRDKIATNPDYPRLICLNILKSIHLYLRGRHADAYKYLEEVFEYIKEPLIYRSSKEHSLPLALYFRGRCIDDNDFIPNKEDMFHIPFHKRHLVKEQRFSQHGIPAIYLGSTPYDCFIELGQPDMEKLWFSLFAFEQNPSKGLEPVQLIDLTVSSDILWMKATMDLIQRKTDAEIKSDLDDLYGEILLWPLIHLCSVATKYSDSPFKQEYIIPKLVFQICMNSANYLGVEYQSTRRFQCFHNVPSFATRNLAFPVRSYAESGYCSTLASTLLLTEPVSLRSTNDFCLASFQYNHTKNGLPILDSYNPNHADKNVYQLDKLTSHFDNLLNQLHSPENAGLLSPLYGWSE